MDWFDFIAKLVVGGICAIAFIASILLIRNAKHNLYLNSLRDKYQRFLDDRRYNG